MTIQRKLRRLKTGFRVALVRPVHRKLNDVFDTVTGCVEAASAGIIVAKEIFKANRFEESKPRRVIDDYSEKLK